ncbi:MAG: tyrosine-type recombinase/integrase [Ferrimicrobium sp.]
MTGAVARWATTEDHALIGDYARFCHDVGVSDRALRDRLRLGRLFLSEHPDLDVWMLDPTRTRLADLDRTKAWPMLSWAALSGRMEMDLELLAAKNIGGMGVTLRQLWPQEYERLWEKARALGWSSAWTRAVIDEFVPVVVASSTKGIPELTSEALDAFEVALAQVVGASQNRRHQWRAQLFSLRQLLFEISQLDTPPRRGREGGSIEERFFAVPGAGIRLAMVRYVTARSSLLSRSSVEGLIQDLIPFGEFIGREFAEVTSLRQLRRHHIEAFLTFNRTRTWRGRVTRDQRVSASVVHAAVLTLRNFFDDITLWGWAERPRSRLVFATDIPRMPRPLPRALPEDIDAALLAAVAQLDDFFACSAIQILRRTGLRIGECLNLELDCVVDYGLTGIWLQVPLGKLKTERSIPLDAETITILEAWKAQRGHQRAYPHPDTGVPTEFLFQERGRPLGQSRIRKGLRDAAHVAGLVGPDGQPYVPTPHQLRHTFATQLLNAGLSLTALMALLGHVTPEMTLRYATLSSPTLRKAYEEAMGKVRKSIPVAALGRTAVPARVDWLASEFLKTRVANGYCSRHLPAGACPYANICETCDNFTPTAQFLSVLHEQLDDILDLKADAERRDWSAEVERHRRVIEALTRHINQLENLPTSETSS